MRSITIGFKSRSHNANGGVEYKFLLGRNLLRRLASSKRANFVIFAGLNPGLPVDAEKSYKRIAEYVASIGGSAAHFDCAWERPDTSQIWKSQCVFLAASPDAISNIQREIDKELPSLENFITMTDENILIANGTKTSFSIGKIRLSRAARAELQSQDLSANRKNLIASLRKLASA